MKLIEKCAAQFTNTKIYIHRRCKKEGQKPDGRYIRISGIFRLGTPNLKHRQFVGVHNHLFVTMNYPDYIKDVFGIGADLPGIPGCGEITWLYPVSCTATKQALWYFFPRCIWGVEPGDYAETITTTTTVSIVAGEGGGNYHILNIPLLTREYLRKRYKK